MTDKRRDRPAEGWDNQWCLHGCFLQIVLPFICFIHCLFFHLLCIFASVAGCVIYASQVSIHFFHDDNISEWFYEGNLLMVSFLRSAL